jgi:hypothetical protein
MLPANYIAKQHYIRLKWYQAVRPSVCPCSHFLIYQRNSHWTDLRKILYWGCVQISVEKSHI